MKKCVFGIAGVITILAIAVSLYAHTGMANAVNPQLQEWERMAEQGDTTALHRLIQFYDENSYEVVEVEEAIEVDAEEVITDSIVCDSVAVYDTPEVDEATAELYRQRLNYWLDKGIAINDPVAIAVKGMRLYFTDEAEAIKYLSMAADLGNAQAALFCGSACLNQGKGDVAFKYLTKAYELDAPSAGWHLAMYYSSGIRTTPNREKAIEVMRHAAIMNYPEAVSEMRRIEPTNKIWQQKADSLNINFEDFPIIPDE